MKSRRTLIGALSLLLLSNPAWGFDYKITGAGDIELTDVKTSISSLKTLFVDQDVSVTVTGVSWEALEEEQVNGTDVVFYKTLVDNEVKATGEISIADVGRELPDSFDVGTVVVNSGGRYTIEVQLTLEEETESTSREVEAYGAGVAIFPLLIILLLAITTNLVEFSLFSGIFVGACIVAGEINAGFKTTLETHILVAVADLYHGYVFLFTFFLSGVVAMLERSGGMLGFTHDISKYAKSARSGQVATFAVGVFVFFDDYANTLLAGQSMRPLIDSLFVSREKLAFFVDATAAPIASISPVSSWVGFEISLIQAEIDRIIEIEGTEDIGIKTSGFGVFLQSIKYRYYPIFMLLLIMMLIYNQRDFGPMLIAERQTEVYKRTDGGDGSTSGKAGAGLSSENEPRKDQPLQSWNMLVPIALLVSLIFFLLVQSGDDGSGTQDFMDKIESSDSYVALLYSTMAVALLTLIFYMVQIVKDGDFIIPNGQSIKELFMAEQTDSEGNLIPKARPLLSLKESVESFVIGMSRVFPAAVVLTLAWATGSVMKEVGCDRLFAAWIVGGVPAETLPTLSFVISMLMALATGTSWGTMSILFPLVLVPTYQSAEGDEVIFYATVAGILSGSVAGDHMSPISDTTVLSSLATECGLMDHVATQAPYVVVVALISIVLGTIPIGYDAMPNIINILLGTLLAGLFAFFFCKPILSPNGDWDYATLVVMKLKNLNLEQLTADTIRRANGEEVEGGDPLMKKDVEDDVDKKLVESSSNEDREEEVHMHA